MSCPYKIKRGDLDYCDKVEAYISQLMTCADNNRFCCYKSAEQVRREEREEQERWEQEHKQRIDELKALQQNDAHICDNYEYGVSMDNYGDGYGGASHIGFSYPPITWKDVVTRLLFLATSLCYLVTRYGILIITIGMAMISVAQVILVVISLINHENKVSHTINIGVICTTFLGIILTAIGLYRNWSLNFFAVFLITYFSPIILFYAGIWIVQWLWDYHRGAFFFMIVVVIGVILKIFNIHIG